MPCLEPLAPLGKWQRAQIVIGQEKEIVEAHEGWIHPDHLRADRFSVEPLLEFSERRNQSIAGDQQFAVRDNRLPRKCFGDIGERRADIVARSRIDARPATPGRDLRLPAVSSG